jgi:hypothetical protein
MTQMPASQTPQNAAETNARPTTSLPTRIVEATLTSLERSRPETAAANDALRIALLSATRPDPEAILVALRPPEVGQ